MSIARIFLLTQTTETILTSPCPLRSLPACGTVHADSDLVVALPTTYYSEANCGKQITISAASVDIPLHQSRPGLPC